MQNICNIIFRVTVYLFSGTYRLHYQIIQSTLGAYSNVWDYMNKIAFGLKDIS